MKYYEMITVDESSEFDQVCEGKRCYMTDDQKEHVKKQVQEIWGEETRILVSPRGVVFAGSVHDDYKTLGRIDAKFNFYSK